jgi:nitric oxide reductase subunit B
MKTMPLDVSPWWRHAAVITVVVGLSGLLFMGRNAYRGAPPIPREARAEDGTVIFTGEDVLAGQAVFQRYGLMDYGTVFGHGGYRGPDFTADYLHRLGEAMRDQLALGRYGRPYLELPPSSRPELDDETRRLLKTDRYRADSGILTLTAGEQLGFVRGVRHYGEYFAGTGEETPLPAHYIRDPEEIRHLTAFFAWTAWAAVTPRPGSDHTYTNNWPSDPSVGNSPSVGAFTWSAISIISLLGALGLVLMFFGRFDYLGWGSRGEADVPVASPDLGSASLSPSQRAVYKFFLVVSLLFLFQTLMGVLTAHYFVEAKGFFGFDIRAVLPTTITRSWHLQLSIFWIATAWLATGLFVGPMLAGKEPRGQATWVDILFGAVILVAVGSIAGEWLGVHGRLGGAWFWLGHQGWEYLELGRLWQALLTGGMALWVWIVFRAIRPTLVGEDRGSLSYLLLYSMIAIPVMFSFGMLYTPRTNFVVADFWRWWIVHLWVEGFFELFTTIVVAHFFVLMGIASRRTALRVVYLDIILYLGSGMIGTAHHYYWTGQPEANLALGAVFSAMEVVPLTLLALEGWDFIRLRYDRSVLGVSPREFPHKWAVMFLMAVGFWNFLGAGVFGFLINLPIVSYYEHATYLTSNHGHGALMGVYGNLAVAALVFCVRQTVRPEKWNDRLWAIAFWSLNLGLLIMLLGSIFPAGIYQMVDSYRNGVWHARSLAVYDSAFFRRVTWARVAGDLVFVIGGTVPIAWFMVTRARSLRKPRGY